MHERIAIVSENGHGAFGQDVLVAGHHLIADEPVEGGGLNAGPDPFEFLLVALGACTSMTLRSYALRKGWAVEHIEVRVSHAQRVSMGAPKDVFDREIILQGDLSEEERVRLFEIAERCPVSLALTRGVVIQTTLSEVGGDAGQLTS
jgi:putative redox protein